MSNSRGNILWVDDEIEHLKPHILFLEKKGYSLSTTSNGQDAIENFYGDYENEVVNNVNNAPANGSTIQRQGRQQHTRKNNYRR